MDPGERGWRLLGGELELDDGEVPLGPGRVVDQVQAGPRQRQALLHRLRLHQDRWSVGYLALKEKQK